MMMIINRFFSTIKNTSARQLIEKTVKENNIVVFMKGTPSQPMCGYSRAVCQILDMNKVRVYEAVNVLEDEQVREEIKAFPTGRPFRKCS